MHWDKTRLEFDSFAAEYDWRYLSGIQPLATALWAACRAAIERCAPATILDCACGPGWQAIELARQGYRVHGTDISAEMIELARRHAAEADVAVTFSVATWEELPAQLDGRFDFTMCYGNAIGHCRDRQGMLASLRALRDVTADGGHVFVDTRSWEWFRAHTQRVFPMGARDDERGHHLLLGVATVPQRWSAAHVIETVHVIERDGQISTAAYPATFYAFRARQLLECLAEAGFDDVQTDYTEGKPYYNVTARACMAEGSVPRGRRQRPSVGWPG